MGDELAGEVVAVYVRHAPLPAHPALAAAVPVGHAVAVPLEAHEAVEGDLPARAQIPLDLGRDLVAHAVGTGADSWCEGQWETSPVQPEELPTQPVGTVVEQIAPPRAKPGFERLDFGRAE